MATEPQTATGAPRIPLFASTANRNQTPDVDARIVNGYIEKTQEGEVVVVKRPGVSLYATLAGNSAAGCYNWNGDIYAIAGTTLYKNGTSIGTVADAFHGGPYSFHPCLGATPKLVFKNNSNAYSWDGVTLATLTFPVNLVPGIAFLDGTLYVGQPPSAVFGSGLNDPTTWNALNVIQAQYESDQIVAVAKQMEYVIVFKNWTIEVFQDAGNPVGSPLAKVGGYTLPFGCFNAYSVQQFEDMLVWASTTEKGSIGIMMMENMRPITISTPAIERLLQAGDWSVVYSWSFRLSGHRFYALTLKTTGRTVVYDFTTQLWFVWGMGLSTTMMTYMCSTTTSTGKPIVQSENGNLYQFDATLYQDAGASFVVDIYTPNWDGGTRNRKVLSRMEVLGDQKGMSTAQLRWSDDDYQTWSSYRTVDLSKKRPFLINLGYFYKRAHHLTYSANTPFRVKALELTTIMEGHQ